MHDKALRIIIVRTVGRLLEVAVGLLLHDAN
jgi:hypothetical protein